MYLIGHHDAVHGVLLEAVAPLSDLDAKGTLWLKDRVDMKFWRVEA